MIKYKIKMPICIGNFRAENRKDAIDNGLRVWKLLIAKMEENGDIYKIPDICQEVGIRNAMKELGNEVPLKPSRWGKKRKIVRRRR